MSYRKDPIKSFADYQVGEGFGQAVTGLPGDLNTEKSASIAMKNVKKLPGGLEGVGKNYVNYEPSQMGDSPGYNGLEGLEGQNGSVPPNGPVFQGFDDVGPDVSSSVKDDAFAGYSTEKGIGDTEKLNDEQDEDALNFNGYGALADSPVESFHTFFHQAATSTSETDLIGYLAQAVKAVPDDAPPALKKQYYDLIQEMLNKKKHGDLRHIDLQRVGIESNMNWLINPKLPKTGGFDALLKVAAGDVGFKLAQGEPDQMRMTKNMALGRDLKLNLNKFDKKQAKKLSGLGDFTANLTYAGLFLIGLAIVGVSYLFLKPKQSINSGKRSKRK